MLNKSIVDNSFGFTNDIMDVCKKLKAVDERELAELLLKSASGIGINLYKATFFKQPGEIYSFVNAAIQSACEAEFYLKIISDRELVDSSSSLTLLNKCVYLRKVAERAQLVR